MLSATGFAARAVRNLANSTAASATFQALVGAGDETAALQHVYWPESVDRLLDGEITDPWPRCIIGPGSAGAMESSGPGSQWDNGVLFWSLELVVPGQYAASPRDRLIWFQNQYSAIIDEIFSTGRTGGDYLRPLKFEPFEDGGPAPLDEDQLPPEITDDVWRVVYAVEY